MGWFFKKKCRPEDLGKDLLQFCLDTAINALNKGLSQVMPESGMLYAGEVTVDQSKIKEKGTEYIFMWSMSVAEICIQDPDPNIVSLGLEALKEIENECRRKSIDLINLRDNVSQLTMQQGTATDSGAHKSVVENILKEAFGDAISDHEKVARIIAVEYGMCLRYVTNLSKKL